MYTIDTSNMKGNLVRVRQKRGEELFYHRTIKVLGRDRIMKAGHPVEWEVPANQLGE